MSDIEVYRLRKEVEYLRDYIDQQRKRHSADIKKYREDLHEEIKYSKKLRAELEQEYKHCEKLRKQLDDRKRLTQELRDELEDEREYSEKLERKLDKRAKVIKDLEQDLLDLEDEYAEARRALKRLDQFKYEAKNAGKFQMSFEPNPFIEILLEIYKSYCKQKIQQLQDEVHSLRSTSITSSPAYAHSALHYVASPRLTPQPQIVHVLNSSNASHLRVPSPRTHTPTPLRERVKSPPASAPELESDYSEDEEGDEQDGRLTEDDDVDEEVAEAELGAVEYAEGDDVPPTPADTTGSEAAPGQKLRELAAREGRLADREYERSRDAYSRGDHAFAKKVCSEVHVN